MTRRRWFLGALAAGIALVSAPARADAPVAKLEVDRTNAQVGDSLIVQLEVTQSGRGRPPEPSIPKAWEQKFEIAGVERGQRSQQVFTGTTFQSSTSNVLTAVLIPRTTGQHTLSFEVDTADGVVRSNTVEIEVGVAKAPEPGEKPTSANKDVFLWATVDKDTVYVGEQLTYTISIYKRRTFVDIRPRTLPSFADFFSEELEVSESESTIESVDGVPYQVNPGLRRALFPQKAGTLTIKAAEVTVGFRQIERSAPISIEVLPLPAEGQPKGFSPNNVGRYTIVARVDQTQVQVGQPLTLTVTIEGEGYIKTIEPPQWPTIAGVRRYDPKVETELRRTAQVGGRRTYSFLVIPEQSGALTIPEHSFSFFDPKARAYQTVKTDPITLQVGGDKTAVAQADQTGASEGDAPLADILVADTLPRIVPRERWLTQERWIYGMVAVPVLAVVGFIGGAIWRRTRPDERARARGHIRLRQRRLLEAAKAASRTGEGFYASLGQLLQQAALDRAGAEGVGLPRHQLHALLRDQGVAQDDLTRLETLQERCDAARFGAQRDDATERNALLDEAMQLIAHSTLTQRSK